MQHNRLLWNKLKPIKHDGKEDMTEDTENSFLVKLNAKEWKQILRWRFFFYFGAKSQTASSF